eukprot:scaffold22676_cov60-Phaeocystis_antarctica.AAC.2
MLPILSPDTFARSRRFCRRGRPLSGPCPRSPSRSPRRQRDGRWCADLPSAAAGCAVPTRRWALSRALAGCRSRWSSARGRRARQPSACE